MWLGIKLLPLFPKVDPDQVCSWVVGNEMSRQELALFYSCCACQKLRMSKAGPGLLSIVESCRILLNIRQWDNSTACKMGSESGSELRSVEWNRFYYLWVWLRFFFGLFSILFMLPYGSQSFYSVHLTSDLVGPGFTSSSQ